MWVTNYENSAKRHFDNNIIAFHIGNGVVLSVAHNLRTENPLLKSISNSIFENEILHNLNPSQRDLFNRSYTIDKSDGKRHLSVNQASIVQSISEALRATGFDSRWITLMEKEMSTPYLVIQFSNNLFYNNPELSKLFDEHAYFYEPSLNRHTYLLKLELANAIYGSDIAIYKLSDVDSAIVDQLPFMEPDFSILEDDNPNIYCLQSSPAGFLGRLLNKAQIEGYLDQYQVFNDRIGGNYVLEGSRYLIKGYFRFGSSGAPYLVYDESSGTFKVNAIQSEASPIQLSINNNREGNYQYVNAIAAPMQLVQKNIEELNT